MVNFQFPRNRFASENFLAIDRSVEKGCIVYNLPPIFRMLRLAHFLIGSGRPILLKVRINIIHNFAMCSLFIGSERRVFLRMVELYLGRSVFLV